MHFPDRRPDQSDQNMLPLINVIFLLLVFFMLVSSLTRVDLFRASLPESESEYQLTEQDLTILIHQNGELALNNQTVTRQQLLDALKEAQTESPELAITIKADGQLAATDLVALTEELSNMGVNEITLFTRSRETN